MPEAPAPLPLAQLSIAAGRRVKIAGEGADATEQASAPPPPTQSSIAPSAAAGVQARTNVAAPVVKLLASVPAKPIEELTPAEEAVVAAAQEELQVLFPVGVDAEPETLVQMTPDGEAEAIDVPALAAGPTVSDTGLDMAQPVPAIDRERLARLTDASALKGRGEPKKARVLDAKKAEVPPPPAVRAVNPSLKAIGGVLFPPLPGPAQLPPVPSSPPGPTVGSPVEPEDGLPGSLLFPPQDEEVSFKPQDAGPVDESTKPEPSLHGVARTFESEAEPEMPMISSLRPPSGPGSRLVAANVVSSMSMLSGPLPPPPPPASGLSRLPAPPQSVAARIKPSLPAPPPLLDVNLDPIEAVAGEPSTHRLMIPVPDVPERSRARAHMDPVDEISRIVDQAVIGAHLITSVHVLAHLHGEYSLRFRVNLGSRSFYATGTIKVKLAPPVLLGLMSMIGSQSSADVPYNGQLWKASTYRAVIEGGDKSFRITASHGSIEAGAKILPFKVVFTPHEPKPVSAMLVVTFNGASEYVVELTGSVCGFQGRQWGRRGRMHAPGSPSAAGNAE